MKLLMTFALLVVASATAKKSDDPCVPCDVLNIVIKVCPDCEFIQNILAKYCETIEETTEDEDEPCVPCEVISKAIQMCPECDVLAKIYKKYCIEDGTSSTSTTSSTTSSTSTSTVVPSEPCVPCQQLKKAISLCPDCEILKKIYKGNCKEITITPEPTYDPTDKMKFTPPPSWMDPCVPCKAVYKAIWYCPDCEVLYDIYLKYCQTSPVTVSSSAVKG